ncbi:GMC oxidoreductase [Auriscalpium vulgare]|uniref:GMC oxidoreductase n=1 Tax=Auriscalpium vulgare TaxID=40419 RepID=A0ACB8RM77_9AGAM|nr:GMC oxidoreductase [Auriscalpium vulgare]
MASTPHVEAEYDIVIAGGGTSAGVLAARLSSVPGLRILVLEAGPPTHDDLTLRQPACVTAHLTPASQTLRFHVSEESAALGGRRLVVPTAACVGGGSTVNFSMYTRASASDYDDWENVYGNAGWGSADLLPLLEKSETYQAQPGARTHGSGGPLKVSYGGHFTNVGKDLLDVARAYDTLRSSKEDADPNDLETVNVYARWPKWIDGDDGTRSDVPNAYLYPLEKNENLTIVPAASVVRVTLDENQRATGLEFVWNQRFLPGADTGVHKVKSTSLVVICAGVFGTPGILERSGIGGAEVLARVGVPQRVDLPGVGESYQDHNGLFVPYTAAPEAETLDPIAQGNAEVIEAASSEWFSTGKGLLAHNSMDIGVKLRPAPSELDAFGTAFRQRWEEYFVPKPDKPVLWLGAFAMLIGDPRQAPPEKYFSMGYFTGYPLALGHVHITDANNVDAPTDFRSGYLEDLADVTPLVWAYKHTRELARRMPLFRGEPPALHPRFAADSPARAIERADGAQAGERIAYTDQDEKAIEAFTRERVTTTWHSIGTCAMKHKDQGGVVDAKLNVYGVTGLKVVDASICPGNVGANTFSTAVGIAEKAALIITDELSSSIVA